MTAYHSIPNATNPLSRFWEIAKHPEGKVRERAKAAAVSTDNVIETIRLIARQIQVTMFGCGVGTLEGLALSLSKG
jgi:hypothetical protein